MVSGTSWPHDVPRHDMDGGEVAVVVREERRDGDGIGGPLGLRKSLAWQSTRLAMRRRNGFGVASRRTVVLLDSGCGGSR